MNTKLIVVFACAIFLSHAAPVDQDLIKFLTNNERFFQYYKEVAHITTVESNEDYMQFILAAISAFKHWIVLLEDRTSEVYRLVVVAQHGNTVISMNQQILLNLFLESLYRHEIQFNQSTKEIVVIDKPAPVVHYNPIPVVHYAPVISTQTVNRVTPTIAPSKPITKIVVNEHKYSPSTANVVITPEDPVLAKMQAANAQYVFKTVVDDNIEGGYQKHEEERKDGAVHGMFEYDDGHIHRSVTYVADENGYQVLGSESLPSTKTVQPNEGATVEIVRDNENLVYHINQNDIKDCHPGTGYHV